MACLNETCLGDSPRDMAHEDEPRDGCALNGAAARRLNVLPGHVQGTVPGTRPDNPCRGSDPRHGLRSEVREDRAEDGHREGEREARVADGDEWWRPGGLRPALAHLHLQTR